MSGSPSPPTAITKDASRYEHDGVNTDLTYVRLPSGLFVGLFGHTVVIVCGSVLTAGDWTFSAWAKSIIQDLTVHHISSFSGANGVYFGGLTAPYENQWGFCDGAYRVADSTVISGVWYHLCVTKTGTTYAFYLNGAYDGGGVYNAIYPSSLRIGDRNGIYYFNGHMSLQKLYNYALALDQINKQFEAERRFFGV
ncbi:hypothetical protein ES703_47202 [subsurface metagenome]